MRFLAILLSLSFLGLPSAAQETRSLETVRIAVNPYLSFAPLFVAEDAGFFAEEGMEAELVDTRRTSIWLAPLLRGDLHAAAGPVTPGLMNAISRGGRVRIVAGKERYGHGSGDSACAYQAIVVSPSAAERARGPADLLRGRKLSVVPASAFHYHLEQVAGRHGVAMETIQLVDLPAPAELAALQAGQIDGFSVGEPWLRRALDSGDAQVAFAVEDDLPGFQAGVLVFGERLLARPDLGRRFLRAYLRGLSKLAEGKTPDNLRILSEALELDEDVLRRSCWPEFPPGATVAHEQLDAYQVWMVEQGLLDRAVPRRDYSDDRFLTAAAEQSPAH